MTDDNKRDGPYKHEHDHSVYTRCLECKSWGISLPSETRCGNCSAEAGVLYVPQCCVRAAYAEGRSSRYGLRSQLVSNNTVLFDVASLVGSGKYFDAIELCHAKISGNNQAIDDDGETK
jgi:hypothetical protein